MSLHKNFKEHVELIARIKQTRQCLLAASKKKGLDRCNSKLDEMKLTANNVLTLSEIFPAKVVPNKKNDRFYARKTEDFSEGCRSILRCRNPTSFMVWVLVASDGPQPPLIFSDAALKVSNEDCVEILVGKVLPWVTETFGDHYIFFQDGTSSHTSNLT